MELGTLGLVVMAVMAVVCGCFTSHVAKNKGFDEGSWFFGGLLFGPLALIAAAGLPDRLQSVADKSAEEAGE